MNIFTQHEVRLFAIAVQGTDNLANLLLWRYHACAEYFSNKSFDGTKFDANLYKGVSVLSSL